MAMFPFEQIIPVLLTILFTVIPADYYQSGQIDQAGREQIIAIMPSPSELMIEINFNVLKLPELQKSLAEQIEEFESFDQMTAQIETQYGVEVLKLNHLMFFMQFPETDITSSEPPIIALIASGEFDEQKISSSEFGQVSIEKSERSVEGFPLYRYDDTYFTFPEGKFLVASPQPQTLVQLLKNLNKNATTPDSPLKQALNYRADQVILLKLSLGVSDQVKTITMANGAPHESFEKLTGVMASLSNQLMISLMIDEADSLSELKEGVDGLLMMGQMMAPEELKPLVELIEISSTDNVLDISLPLNEETLQIVKSILPSPDDFKNQTQAAKTKACVANMKVLEGALEMYQLDSMGLAPEEPLSEISIDFLVSEGYLSQAPECPEGGTYSVQQHPDDYWYFGCSHEDHHNAFLER